METFILGSHQSFRFVFVMANENGSLPEKKKKTWEATPHLMN
jgi:hypothetical protein